MTEGQKLKKAQIRTLPKSVADRVLALQKRYRSHACTLYIEDPTWKLYLAEATTYTCYDGRGKEFTLKMQSSMSLHAGGHKMSHQIGQRYGMPQGSWVVEFGLFLGKPVIAVHHIGPYQLSA